MRAVVQRVSRARVTVAGENKGEISAGLLILLGVAKDDTEKEAAQLAERVAQLRIFSDDDGKMNLSVEDSGGSVLVVSQFTLHGDCRKGRRPSFGRAAPAEQANRLYEQFVEALRGRGLKVETGVFQAMMEVELVNNGPVTLILDTDKSFY